MTGQTDHEKAVEAVAAKLRSPSTFPGDTATAVARELIDAYLKAIPSPSSQMMGMRSEVEAVFRRHIEAAPYAKDLIKRIAFEVVPLLPVVALETPEGGE